MKLKLLIIGSLAIVALTVMLSLGLVSENNIDQVTNNPAHQFTNFKAGTTIETEVVNRSTSISTYPLVSIQNSSEALMAQNKESYQDNYYVHYKIKQPSNQTFDTKIIVNKLKKTSQIEIKNMSPKTRIKITDGNVPLHQPLLTDWSGKIEIDNVFNKKICIVTMSGINTDATLCHTTTINKGDAHA